jgi:hypothetical protein
MMNCKTTSACAFQKPTPTLGSAFQWSGQSKKKHSISRTHTHRWHIQGGHTKNLVQWWGLPILQGWMQAHGPTAGQGWNGERFAKWVVLLHMRAGEFLLDPRGAPHTTALRNLMPGFSSWVSKLISGRLVNVPQEWLLWCTIVFLIKCCEEWHMLWIKKNALLLSSLVTMV